MTARSTTVVDGSGPSAGGTRIQSVSRAAQILLVVAEAPGGAAVKEIAAALGLPLPTTYHLLNTLVDQGFLAKDPDRRYVLGPSAGILAQAYLRGNSVPQYMLAALRELAELTRETVYLADWGERDIRVLASVEGSQILRVAEVAGGPYEDGHARANGKVLLAYAWPEFRTNYLSTHPLRRLTPATICDADEFEEELARIRKRGCAYDSEEYALGVSCVAAPLLDHGRIVAAFGVSVPIKRFQTNRAELTETLLRVIAQCEARQLEGGE